MILTMRERVGVPEDVLARTPIIERKRIPTAKVQFKLEKGMRTTMMDWGMAQGLTLLLLLGLFTRVTTWERKRQTLYQRDSFWHDMTKSETFLLAFSYLGMPICHLYLSFDFYKLSGSR